VTGGGGGIGRAIGAAFADAGSTVIVADVSAAAADTVAAALMFFLGVSADAFRVRSHSANDEQARERANLLTLEGIASRIECPLFVIAAGLDRLCPPEDAKRLAAEVKGPVDLLVIDDGNHVAHNRPYRYRPQSADWMAERLGAQAH
jgi:pimeloyl-ACP methyl ester carboxylesterase